MNDELLRVKLAPVERFQAKSKDGTPIQGFLTLPAGRRRRGKKLPTILRIHGGPVSQYSTAFELEWQMLAAARLRGDRARTRAARRATARDFSRAIWADWGNKDFEDVMAAVDHVVGDRRRRSRPARRRRLELRRHPDQLRDHARPTRFKAAISGASRANYFAGYGTDHYQYEWEAELGLPWKNPELWLRLSPFFQVEQRDHADALPVRRRRT